MLRTVKFLALVAMFFMALSSSAQVTTSALSDVVTNENQQAMIGATNTVLHTLSSAKYYSMKCMDGRYTIQDRNNSLSYLINEQPHVHTEDGSMKVESWPLFLLCALVVFVLLSFVFIVAIFKDKNIKIKFLNFIMEIGSKKENKR